MQGGRPQRRSFFNRVPRESDSRKAAAHVVVRREEAASSQSSLWWPVAHASPADDGLGPEQATLSLVLLPSSPFSSGLW